MEPAIAVLLIGVVLVIAALVVYLVAVILELRKITEGLDKAIEAVVPLVEKSKPVNGIVKAINKDLTTGTELLEGLLEKKAGQDDAAGLIESVYPGAGASVLERQGRAGEEVKNIDVVYTRGAAQLARLGRASPLGAGPMSGPAIRDTVYSSAASREMYTNEAGPTSDRPGGPLYTPRSPTIGVDAPQTSEAASDPGEADKDG